MVPTRLRTGVTGGYGAMITTLTCIPATHVAVTLDPSMSTHVKVGLPRLGMRPFCVARTAAVCVVLPSAPRLPGIDARDPGDLACRLGDAVVHVDPAAEVEDGQHQHQEDRECERELDQRLAAAPLTSAHQLVTVTVLSTCCVPPRFEAVSSMV